MFDNIYPNLHNTPELTVALVDGPHVRYVVAFLALNDGHLSSVTCTVVEAGNSAPISLSVCEHCRH